MTDRAGRPASPRSLPMQNYLHSLASGSDWEDACSRALAGLGRIPANAGLGFAYIGDAIGAHAGQILDYLRERTQVRDWVGSVGAGIVGTGREVYDEPVISLLVTDLAADSYRIIPSITEDCSEFLGAQAQWRSRNFSSVAIVHADPRNSRIPQLISQLAQGLEGGFLAGGLSSAADDQLFQIAGDVTDGGISGVLFAAGVTLAAGHTQGCSLIGTRHEVTDAEGNILKALDNRPALEVFKEDIGDDLARDLQQVGGNVFAALPIRGSDTGDYLVRNLLGLDPESGLIAIGDRMEEGMYLQFARRDPDTARDDLRQMLAGIKSRLQGPAKGALYFSCLGRGRHLFGDDSAEMRLIQDELGNLPLAGFYANGEISHNRLYGYTGVLVVFTGD